jgi:hypothetical protein
MLEGILGTNLSLCLDHNIFQSPIEVITGFVKALMMPKGKKPA